MYVKPKSRDQLVTLQIKSLRDHPYFWMDFKILTVLEISIPQPPLNPNNTLDKIRPL